MTYAPETLRDLAAYWVRMGGVNLGIVGDLAHQGRASYHNGQDAIDRYGRTAANDYSIRLTRDKEPYLTNAAAALDLGRLDGSLTNLQKFSRWLVEQCRIGAPITRDIREVIYSPDGKVVKRWDNVDKVLRAGYPTTTGQGDSSHLWHTHTSWRRDSEGRAKVALFAAYFGEETMPIELYEAPKKARLTADAVLYEDAALTKVAWKDLDTKNPDGSVRYFLYPGYVSAEVRCIGYEPAGGDTNSTSRMNYIKTAHIAGSSVLLPPPATPPPPPPPEDCTDEVAAERARWEEWLAESGPKVDQAVRVAVDAVLAVRPT